MGIARMSGVCAILFVVAASLILSAHSLSFLTARFHYPADTLAGRHLYIRGDSLGLNWNKGVLLAPCPKALNCWSHTFLVHASSVGSTFSSKVLVSDQTWMIGANIQVVLPKTNSSFDFYPFFFSNVGEYELLPKPIASRTLNNSRNVVVYTPPSYFENTLKPMTNVLIMHDGQNLFNDSTSFAGRAWRCQDTINQLVPEGKMEEVLIIGVYNTPNRIAEYTYSVDPTVGQGGAGNLYLDFLISGVLPVVKHYYPRISVKRENLGILGSSLGGLISCYAGWTRSHTYSKAGCMSSSFWWNSEDFNNTIMNKFKVPASETFYLDSGNAGEDNDDVTQTQTVRNHMIADEFELNYDLFYYLDNGGQHSEYYWGTRFHVPMTSLYPPTTTPTVPN